jgi:hypothetical protein
LPGDPLCDADAAQALLGELRRTMAAIQNQLNGTPIDSIVLCGSGSTQSTLAQAIQAALDKPTELFSPFAGLTLGGELARQLPENAGRYAPLLGMLVDEADKSGHAIDFLHPRRRPEPPNRRRQYLIAGGVAAVLIFAYLAMSWWSNRELASQIRGLKARSKAISQKLVTAEKTARGVEDLVRWNEGEVVWLEQIRTLCEKLPPATEVMLTQIEMRSTETQGAEIKLDGLAREPGSIDALESRLGRVKPRQRSLDPSQPRYPWRFGSSLLLGEEKK